MNKKIMVLILGVFVLFGATMFAYRASALLPEIKICVNKSSGAVNVIGSGVKKDSCQPNEILLTINAQGEKGDQGIQGVPGVKGDTGPQGIQGLQGAVGPQGETGPQGSKGDTGPQGDVGPQGPNSLVGMVLNVAVEATSNTKTLTATCPDSNPVVIGGGIKDTGSTIEESYPSASNAWTVTITGNKNNWTAYAICSK